MATQDLTGFRDPRVDKPVSLLVVTLASQRLTKTHQVWAAD
jgi:hypothetical protein